MKSLQCLTKFSELVQSNVDYPDLLGDLKRVWLMANMNINEFTCLFAHHAGITSQACDDI